MLESSTFSRERTAALSTMSFSLSTSAPSRRISLLSSQRHYIIHDTTKPNTVLTHTIHGGYDNVLVVNGILVLNTATQETVSTVCRLTSLTHRLLLHSPVRPVFSNTVASSQSLVNFFNFLSFSLFFFFPSSSRFSDGTL